MDVLEKKISDIIENKKDDIIAAGRYIWSHPEMGFKEYGTADLFASHMRSLGLKITEGLAITGVKSKLKDNAQRQPTVALMGEMDALPAGGHPDAGPLTGAVHSCGHNAQLAGVIGAAYALTDKEISETMGGNIAFFAVPAEEFVDIEFKQGLIRQGKLGFGGGKAELIRIGALDDVDITVGHHILPDSGVTLFNSSTNGFLNKSTVFRGRSAHAAMCPEKGVDALGAAALAMHAIDIQRGSFRDSDNVRIYGYVSYGGEAMNVIADTVKMEHSVRACTLAAIRDASAKFDRAVRSGAVATGCGIEITTVPGYLPVIPVEDVEVMEDAIRDVAEGVYPIAHLDKTQHFPGSTDFGDVSQLMPVLEFYTGGYTGEMHSPDVRITDEYLAYVVTAKMFALTAFKLLKKNAQCLKKLLGSYSPALSKKEYLDYMYAAGNVEKMELSPLPLINE